MVRTARRCLVERLDRAKNDHELSEEVTAALMGKKHEVLSCYIETRINGLEPSRTARAIMVAGFCDNLSSAISTLKKLEGTRGLVGKAVKAASYAHERNIWARHWYRKMYEAKSPTDFWRAQVLFTKVVDGRYDVWASEVDAIGCVA